MAVVGVAGTPPSGDWQLAAGHFIPAKMTPVIIGPSAATEVGTDAAWSRYRRCPSGIAYRIPVAVLGGAWPFKYEIVSGPSGMTIGQFYGDTDYGILSWSNPTTTGSPHTVSVKITDQDGTQATREWELEVIDRENTTYFLFCDAANGSDSTGDGSYSDPYQTVLGWYGTTPGATTGVGSTTYPGRQTFYRAGTYELDLITDASNGYVYWNLTRKPGVHVAYPGETVYFDSNEGIIDLGTPADFCLSGIHLINGNQTYNSVVGARHSYVRTFDPNRQLYFENTFGQLGSVATAGGSNSAAIMFLGGAGYYTVVHSNTFAPNVAATSSQDAILSYDGNSVVFESNAFDDSGEWGVYLKSNGASNWSIRNNRGTTIGRGFFTADFSYRVDSTNVYDNIEICWNSIRASVDPMTFKNGNTGADVGEVFVYRNSLYGATDVPHNTAATQTANPTVIYEKNVIDGCGLASGTVTFSNDSTSQTDVTDWLNATTNLLEGDGLTYKGTHGAEVE